MFHFSHCAPPPQHREKKNILKKPPPLPPYWLEIDGSDRKKFPDRTWAHLKGSNAQCLKTHSFLYTCKNFFLLFFSFSCIIGCLNKRKSKGFNKIFILSDGKMSTNLAARTILMKYLAIKCNLKNLHKNRKQ